MLNPQRKVYPDANAVLGSLSSEMLFPVSQVNDTLGLPVKSNFQKDYFSVGAPDSFQAFQPPAMDQTFVYPIF
jgi:hypothetical protein